MANERNRKRLPPYVSYRTFINFIGILSQKMPSRIDRSYWETRLSGSTGTQMMAAFRFLGLIDENGWPTERLKPLVEATREQRPKVLREIAARSYDFVLKGPVDPQNATYSQLEETFRDKFKLTGQLSQKCLRFFIALSHDAGIPLSSFITQKVRSSRSGNEPRVITKKSVIVTKSVTKNGGSGSKRNRVVPSSHSDSALLSERERMLLDKFPSFDPSWSQEVQRQWFAAYDQLLKLSAGGGQK